MSVHQLCVCCRTHLNLLKLNFVTNCSSAILFGLHYLDRDLRNGVLDESYEILFVLALQFAPNQVCQNIFACKNIFTFKGCSKWVGFLVDIQTLDHHIEHTYLRLILVNPIPKFQRFPKYSVVSSVKET